MRIDTALFDFSNIQLRAIIDIECCNNNNKKKIMELINEPNSLKIIHERANVCNYNMISIVIDSYET